MALSPLAFLPLEPPRRSLGASPAPPRLRLRRRREAWEPPTSKAGLLAEPRLRARHRVKGDHEHGMDRLYEILLLEDLAQARQVARDVVPRERRSERVRSVAVGGLEAAAVLDRAKAGQRVARVVAVRTPRFALSAGSSGSNDSARATTDLLGLSRRPPLDAWQQPSRYRARPSRSKKCTCSAPASLGPCVANASVMSGQHPPTQWL